MSESSEEVDGVRELGAPAPVIRTWFFWPYVVSVSCPARAISHIPDTVET